MLLRSQQTVEFAMTALSLTKPLIRPWSSMGRVGQSTMTTARPRRTMSGARSGRRHPSRRYRSAGSSRLEIILAMLGKAGMTTADLVKVTTSLIDAKNIPTYARVRGEILGEVRPHYSAGVSASYSVPVFAVPASLPRTPTVCIRVGNRRGFHPCGVVEYFRPIRMKRVYNSMLQQ